MKRIVALMLVLVMVFAMAACGTTAKPAETTEKVEAPADVAMQYITAEELSAVLGSEDYMIIDVRKAADNAAAHIPGAVAADMDAAKEGDFAAGVATMTPVVEGVDKNLVLVCYSGKRYAQATTNALASIGYDMSKVFTLEGGFNNWSEVYPELVEAPVQIVAPESDVAMQYITAEELSTLLNDEAYMVIDVRKAADSAAATIPGAVAADMDAAKEGDFAAGVATMQPVVEGADKNLVLVCYSGKRYAQATTNVLSALGYDMSKVYTLEGGFNNWSETYPELVKTPVEIVAPESDVAMQYITAEELSTLLEDENYMVIDVRKAADSSTSTIPGAVAADMDAAKEGDFAAGVATMQPVVEGVNKNLVLVCYSGKRYAQATTNVLSALGYDMTKVFTLEGGFKNWSEVYPELVG